jgi:hypothetical protein
VNGISCYEFGSVGRYFSESFWIFDFSLTQSRFCGLCAECELCCELVLGFASSGNGGGPSNDNARGGGRVAAAAAAGGVAAELVFRVAAGVAAVREAGVQEEQLQPPLPSEPRLDHSAPFQCRHLRSVTHSSCEILALCAFRSWCVTARLQFQFVGHHSSPEFKALDQGRVLVIVECEATQAP